MFQLVNKDVTFCMTVHHNIADYYVNVIFAINDVLLKGYC